MIVIGPVAFTFTLGMGMAAALYALVLWGMPKRALIGLVAGFFAAIWFMTGANHANPIDGQYFYVSVWLTFSFFFTCMMSPLMVISFIVGYKMQMRNYNK